MVYRNDGRPIKMLDNIIPVVMIVFVSLLFMSGVEYISFTTGLLVGTTVIQVYFHRFSDPLPPDKRMWSLRVVGDHGNKTFAATR
jgi:hypothetical protein